MIYSDYGSFCLFILCGGNMQQETMARISLKELLDDLESDLDDLRHNLPDEVFNSYREIYTTLACNGLRLAAVRCILQTQHLLD